MPVTVRRWACNSLCTRVAFVTSRASSTDWTSLTVSVNIYQEKLMHWQCFQIKGGGGGGRLGMSWAKTDVK